MIAFSSPTDTTITFNCPRCDEEHTFDPEPVDSWQCSVCDITLHFSDGSFIDILLEVQKHYDNL